MSEALDTTAAIDAPPELGDGSINPFFRQAARLTAQTLLLENEGLVAANPDHQSDVTREQEMGEQELAEGDTEALADEEEKAIQHYRNAWLHASSARLYATRKK